MKRLTHLCLVGLLFASAASVRADIFQWEYINPGNPALGKQQSTALCPDGAGKNAVPGAYLVLGDLTMAYLIGKDLNGANAPGANLTNADLSQANLTNATFQSATLTGANLSGAEVRGANFNGSGITVAQLYSTASYLAHDLTGIKLEENNLASANFVGQNLTNADIRYAHLDNANFSQANLTHALFYGATLTGANLAGATVQRAEISGITRAQLYSTASYLTHDLTGTVLDGSDLTGANFADQNLTNSGFYSTSLTGANFRQANLTNSTMVANLTNADLRQATLTGTSFQNGNAPTLTGTDFTGAILRGTNFAGPIVGFTVARLYSTASYQAHDLTGVSFGNVYGSRDVSGWDFAGQNLTDASFYGAPLTGANLAGATVRGANFTGAPSTGLTAAQLYSTASYQAHDLTGIGLGGLDVSGWNFAGQLVAHASFSSDFTVAQLYSTASYQAHDLTGIGLSGNDLMGWNFASQNLTNAYLAFAKLDGADLTGAEVHGASFQAATYHGFIAAQLYSTASYKAHNLTGIELSYNDLTGWNFAAQNLTDAHFGGATLIDANFSGASLTNAWVYQTVLTGANFSNANLRDANFSDSRTNGGTNFSHANLQNARFPLDVSDEYNSEPLNFTGADARGTYFAYTFEAFPDAVVTNLIQPDGHIRGLDLSDGQLLVVRDYDGGINNFGNPIPPYPIHVDQHMVMGPGDLLQVEFDADAWDSTISFAAGIPVTLGGTLDLGFAEGVSLAGQIGRTFDLFDWTDVAPMGAFTVSSSYVWDLSKLYTTGDVTFLAAAGVPGDFNNDGSVDAGDYVAWRKGLGTTYTQAALDVWRAHFGQTAGSGAALPSVESPSAAVPEPSALVLLSFGLAALVATRPARPTQRGGERND